MKSTKAPLAEHGHQCGSVRALVFNSELIALLLRDGSWIDRRVATLQIQDIDEASYFLQRRISLSINVEHLYELSKDYVIPAAHLALPLGLFNKDLLLDFSLTDATGASLPVMSRRMEAQAALEFALKCVNTPLEGLEIRKSLLRYVSSLSRSSGQSVQDLLGSLAQLARSSKDIEWVKRARSSARFVPTLEILRHHHIVIGIIPSPSSDFVLKIERREQIPLTSLRRRVRYPRPMPFRFELADFGWATSDHLRLFAPRGTDVSDIVAYSAVGSAPVSVWMAASPGKTSMYRFSPSAESGAMHIRVLGLLRPAGIYREWATVRMLGLMLVALLSGAIWELATLMVSCGLNPLDDLPGRPGIDGQCHGPLWDGNNIESIITLTSLIATVFLGLSLRQDEHPVRAELLERWRRTSFGALACPWVAGAALLAPRAYISEMVLWGLWLVLALLLALLLALQIVPAYLRFGGRNRGWAEWPIRRVIFDQAS